MKEQTIWDVEKLMGLKRLSDRVVGNKNYVRYGVIDDLGRPHLFPTDHISKHFVVPKYHNV